MLDAPQRGYYGNLIVPGLMRRSRIFAPSAINHHGRPAMNIHQISGSLVTNYARASGAPVLRRVSKVPEEAFMLYNIDVIMRRQEGIHQSEEILRKV